MLVGLQHARFARLLPPPCHVSDLGDYGFSESGVDFSSSRRKLFITKKRISRIDIFMDTEYFLLSDVSRILRCQNYHIVYLLTTRQVQEPRLRIGGKRIFTIHDIQRIAEKLQVPLAQEIIARGEA